MCEPIYTLILKTNEKQPTAEDVENVNKNDANHMPLPFQREMKRAFFFFK